jgi:hypothetical protein
MFLLPAYDLLDIGKKVLKQLRRRGLCIGPNLAPFVPVIMGACLSGIASTLSAQTVGVVISDKHLTVGLSP